MRGGFLSMLLGILGASLLENILAGKGVIVKRQGQGINRAGEGIVRAGYRNKRRQKTRKKVKIMKTKWNFNAASSLTNFEIQKYYQNEPGFNGIYSRDNLPRIKDGGAYIINLDDYSCIGTHWVALYVKNNYVAYFDSFGVEHIPKEIRIFIGNKNIKSINFRIQAYNSIMYEYFVADLLILYLQERL